MIAFVLISTMLLLAAVLFAVMPLLSRPRDATSPQHRDLNRLVIEDQVHELGEDLSNGVISSDSFALARADLDRRLTRETACPEDAADLTPPDRRTGAALFIIVALIAIGLYLLLGTPAALREQQAEPALATAQVPAPVAVQPDAELNGMVMQAGSLRDQGRYREAADLYARIAQLAPDNADVLADYADALAMANNRQLGGQPEQLIDRALQIDPHHVKALALAGSAAFERKDFAGAVRYWNTLLAQVDPQSEVGRAMAANISEAQGLLGQTTAPTPSKSIPALAITGQVTVDNALRGKVAPGAALFVFARANNGPRFPLAVQRASVGSLPLQYRLDDTMGMMPGVKLSDYAEVVIGARISSAGSAVAQPGDLEGFSAPVKPGSTNVNIVINSVHP